MTTIYLKSPDEKTVVSIRGTHPCPDDYLWDGYTIVDYKEFRRVKYKIQHPKNVTEEVDDDKV